MTRGENMRFIMTFIVSFLLMQMAFYVLGNMSGADYSFATATVVGLIMSVLVLIIGEGLIPNEESEA